MAEEVLVTYTY